MVQICTPTPPSSAQSMDAGVAPEDRANGSLHKHSTSGASNLNPLTSALFKRISGALTTNGDGSKHDGTPSSRNGSIAAAPFPPDDDSEEERSSSTTLPSMPPPLGAVPSSGFLKSPQARSIELCQYFGLPDTETFLDDYNCALRKRVLLQGRMYIFDHYVCFSSFVFGFAKKVVIPLEKVVTVRKKTHLRFPNSIKIELQSPHGGVDKYFFTSFLSREDAYQLISSCAVQSRAHPTDHDYMRDEVALLTGSVPNNIMPNDELAPVASGESAPARLARVTADEDDEDEECEITTGNVWGTITAGSVPKPHNDSRVVLRAVLDGTPREMFDMLFADNSHFFEDFLESQGNRRINLASWKRDAQLGHVRDIQFVAPIKGAFSNWGVPTTQCHQSHRFRQFAGEHLVFESSQTMTDIPYGDCFTVDVRWDISPLPDPAPAMPLCPDSPFAEEVEMVPVPQMQVVIAVRVPFSAMCLFKKVIESGVIKGVKENHTALVSQLRTALAQLERDKQPVQLGSPHTLVHRLSATEQPARTLSRGASGAHLRQSMKRLTASQSMRQGVSASSPLGVPITPTSKPWWQPWSHVRNGSSMLSMLPNLRRPLNVALPNAQDVNAFVSDVQDSVGEHVAPGSMWPTLLMVLVLVVQLCVLYFTLVVRQAPRQVVPSSHTWRNGLDDQTVEQLLSLGREMWARRAVLLNSELTLLQQTMQAVEEQLQVAQAHAAQVWE